MNQQTPAGAALRNYCEQDTSLGRLAWPADVPEVSGAITKTYDFKVRVLLPLDRQTQAVLATRSDSYERLDFVRSLAKNLSVQAPRTPMTVVGLHVSEQASKVFKAPGDEPGVVVLFSVRLSYSAHRVYQGAELRQSLTAFLDHDRYRQEDFRIEVRDNH